MAEQPKSYEKVLTYLEDSLRSGQLSLGDPLPPERELAEQLGISRNSVREAVRLLEHMGFIVSNQGAGNFICCNIQRNLQDSFDLLMLLQQIDYRRLGELRAGLELQAACWPWGASPTSRSGSCPEWWRRWRPVPPSGPPNWISSSMIPLPPSQATS